MKDFGDITPHLWQQVYPFLATVPQGLALRYKNVFVQLVLQHCVEVDDVLSIENNIIMSNFKLKPML